MPQGPVDHRYPETMFANAWSGLFLQASRHTAPSNAWGMNTSIICLTDVKLQRQCSPVITWNHVSHGEMSGGITWPSATGRSPVWVRIGLGSRSVGVVCYQSSFL